MINIRNWELWPFKVIYAPLAFLWLYYVIKARSFWFFSTTNPTLEFSGFEGEAKKEMYSQLPVSLYPTTIYTTAQQAFADILDQLNANGIQFPIIAKPDVGMHGILVRKLNNVDELQKYHKHVPADCVLQDYVDLPLEFSVFHIRYPDAEKGIITGFIQKEYLQVVGDGTSTLLQLIKNHSKAKYREAEMMHLHKGKTEIVLPRGEKFDLSYTGNHNRGARFINLHDQIDERLCNVFDKISIEAGAFYYGRYDFKCTSIEDLKQGKNIIILEYNGAGAEPNHIYDCGMSYRRALKEISTHWKHMYNIAKINHKKGVPYWSFKAGKAHLDKADHFFKTLRKYDLNF